MRIAPVTTLSQSSLRTSFIPLLRDRVFNPIRTQGTAGVDEAIALMDAYGINRDDAMETLPLFQLAKIDPLQGVESKVKAAFTRKYNQGSHTSQGLHSTAMQQNDELLLKDLKVKGKGKGKGKGKAKAKPKGKGKGKGKA